MKHQQNINPPCQRFAQSGWANKRQSQTELKTNSKTQKTSEPCRQQVTALYSLKVRLMLVYIG